MFSIYYTEKPSIYPERRNKMRSDLVKIITAQYVFLFITHFFGYLFFVFILDIVNSQTIREKKFPGIDLKEFR
jgi:hypothetical protein